MGGTIEIHRILCISMGGTYTTGYGWAVYIMAETRSLAPIDVDG